MNHYIVYLESGWPLYTYTEQAMADAFCTKLNTLLNQLRVAEHAAPDYFINEQAKSLEIAVQDIAAIEYWDQHQPLLTALTELVPTFDRILFLDIHGAWVASIPVGPLV